MAVSVPQVKLAAKAFLKTPTAPTRDYIETFGASPKVIAGAFNTCSFDDDIKLVHLLWSLYFLKTYGTERKLARDARVSDRTFRDRVWSVLHDLSTKGMPKVVSIVSLLSTGVLF